MGNRRAFTIVELLVTLGIIGLLVGLLLPALSIVRGNAAMTNSTSNMRQTFMLMGNYSASNRETVVPSLFDHSQVAVKGKVRADANPPAGNRHMGTWADILWTEGGFGPIVVDADDGAPPYDYRSDDPDGSLWVRMGDFERGPLRATIQTRKVFDGTVSADTEIQNNAYGSVCVSQLEPGMFAANNFFDARPGTIDASTGTHSRRRNTNHPFDAVCNASANRVAMNQPMANATGSTPPQYSMYFTTGQILRPDGSAYLIDSLACQTSTLWTAGRWSRSTPRAPIACRWRSGTPANPVPCSCWTAMSAPRRDGTNCWTWRASRTTAPPRGSCDRTPMPTARIRAAASASGIWISDNLFRTLILGLGWGPVVSAAS